MDGTAPRPLHLQGDERIKESVLTRAAQQAEREPDSTAAGPTPEDLRRMMAAAPGPSGAAAASAAAAIASAGGGARPLPPATPVPHSEFGVPGEAEGGGEAALQEQGGRSGAASRGSCYREGGEEWEGERSGGGGGGGTYSVKSIRKIMDEMKARGWRQVQVRLSLTIALKLGSEPCSLLGGLDWLWRAASGVWQPLGGGWG